MRVCGGEGEGVNQALIGHLRGLESIVAIIKFSQVAARSLWLLSSFLEKNHAKIILRQMNSIQFSRSDLYDILDLYYLDLKCSRSATLELVGGKIVSDLAPIW